MFSWFSSFIFYLSETNFNFRLTCIVCIPLYKTQLLWGKLLKTFSEMVLSKFTSYKRLLVSSSYCLPYMVLLIFSSIFFLYFTSSKFWKVKVGLEPGPVFTNHPLENTVGKGETACNEQFLLFLQCFLTFWVTFSSFSSNFKLSFANSFSLGSLKFVVWERVNYKSDVELLSSAT